MNFSTVLTISNSLLIIFIIVFSEKKFKYYFTLEKKTTHYKNRLLGFELTLWSRKKHRSIFSIFIGKMNARKIELKEEIEQISKFSQQNKLQTLTAIFSWLKTLDKVKEFEKYYSSVDEKIVRNLVENFKTKNNII